MSSRSVRFLPLSIRAAGLRWQGSAGFGNAVHFSSPLAAAYMDAFRGPAAPLRRANCMRFNSFSCAAATMAIHNSKRNGDGLRSALTLYDDNGKDNPPSHQRVEFWIALPTRRFCLHRSVTYVHRSCSHVICNTVAISADTGSDETQSLHCRHCTASTDV
jgi:hypothetical protein